MKWSSSPKLVAPVLFAALCLAACSSEPEGSAGSSAPADSTVPVEPSAGAERPGSAAPSAVEIDAGCTEYFDALLARRKRCASGQATFGLDASEVARDSFMAVCRQRSTRPGTGYTPQFHETCAKAFSEAACEDYDAIVRACWEPRGKLAAGSGCSTDDQCADGYCRLPSGASPGSTCGTCAVPIWGRTGTSCSETRDVKCVPGLLCMSDSYGQSGRSCRVPQSVMASEGEACIGTDGSSSTGKYCNNGLYCKNGRCARRTVVPVGAFCRDDELACEDGSDCIPTGDFNDKCVKRLGIGQTCGIAGAGYCNDWVECGATKKCELRQPDLDCSSAPSAPAADEPAKCVGAATSCSGRPAGTCAGQDGCSLVQHYKTGASGGYFEYECEGTPRACSSIQSESGCLRQTGCRWQ